MHVTYIAEWKRSLFELLSPRPPNTTTSTFPYDYYYYYYLQTVLYGGTGDLFQWWCLLCRVGYHPLCYRSHSFIRRDVGLVVAGAGGRLSIPDHLFTIMVLLNIRYIIFVSTGMIRATEVPMVSSKW